MQMSSKKMNKSISVTAFMPGTLVQRIDDRVTKLRESTQHSVTRSDVIRELVAAGLRDSKDVARD
jgi:hypothetical protein